MKRKCERQTPSEQQTREEQTQPLPPLAPLVLEHFLARYQPTLLDVARAAGVRLLTVWRVVHDYPISGAQAEQVRLGLYRLTGASYRGRIRISHIQL